MFQFGTSRLARQAAAAQIAAVTAWYATCSTGGMTDMLSPSRTVASVVLDHSECAEVFQRHRIDFCCRGDLSLESAARERGVELVPLMGELERAIAARGGSRDASMRDVPTAELIEHIVEKHHGYLRRALPFLRPLAAKVARVHGEHDPRLRELDEAVAALAEALLDHLDDEERTLFPALGDRRATAAETATLLSAMHDEHLAVSRMLERVRAAAEDFTLPDWACNSYRALFRELAALEGDVFTHVHLENHVLKPRFEAPPAA
jgi:regulator of cell morphogenesis and NO signaling